MKPSLIYFPISGQSPVSCQFRSSIHSLATFHENDIPNFRFSMVMVWCDNLPSVGLALPHAVHTVRPEECATACFLFRLYHRHDIRDFPTAGLPPTGWVQDAPCIRLSATGGCLPAYRGTVSGIAACRRQRHSTGRLPVLRMIRCNAVSIAMHPVGGIQGSSCATVL